MSRGLVALSLVLAASACKHERSSDLEQRVEAALRSEPAVMPISVEAKDGIVTLSGVVDSEGDRAHIREIARAVPGVLAVDDRVVVRPPPILTAATPDAVLAATIESRLRAADFAPLDVEVHDKTVRISGSVRRDRHADAMRIVVETAPRGYRVEDALAEAPVR
jgi:osmotically-inducible protein OsmY